MGPSRDESPESIAKTLASGTAEEPRPESARTQAHHAPQARLSPASIVGATLLGARGRFEATSGTASALFPVEPDVVDVAAADFEQRYERKTVLGVGGMGEVLLCKDHHVGREVALKVIRDKAAASGVRARFLREARIQGQLEHPAIVPVYDLGVDGHGDTFFTMKRIRGLTLDAVLHAIAQRDTQIVATYSRRKLLTAFNSVCLAIDFAHRRGVVHRDLKPSNIILGSFGEVYVLDWGIAKARGMADDAATEALELAATEGEGTQDGALLGTPGYMAPEQARGRLDSIDARTDVYALGAILFEILAGQPLHEPTSVQALLRSTLDGADARPSQRAREAIPPELDAICQTATALEPAARFDSARALSEAIERFLDGDRDGQLRRDLAERHVAAARAALGTEADTPSVSMALALREVSSAIALDPGNTEALSAMAHLLGNVPDTVPTEAEPELARALGSARRQAARSGANRYFLWTIFLPLVFWMGVRDLRYALVTGLSMMLCAGMAYRMSRKTEVTNGDGLLLLILTSLAPALVSGLFGPFILVPGLVATNTMFFAMNTDRQGRVLVVLAGVTTILTPWLLELCHVVPRGYTFRDGFFQVWPRAAELPEVPTLTALVITSVAMVIIPGVLMGRMRDALVRAERRVFLQAWHLRQLVPSEAQGALSRRKPRSLRARLSAEIDVHRHPESQAHPIA